MSRTWLDKIESRISLAHYVIAGASILPASLATYFASVTPIVQEYYPLSYIILFVTFFFLAAFSVMFLMWAREFYFRSRLFEMQSRKSSSLNPLEPVFRGERVNINEMTDPISGSIQGKTFIDCDIIGPATILIVDNCHFDTVGFSECNVLTLKNGVEYRNKPLIIMHGCTFRGGRIFACNLIVPDPVSRQLELIGINVLTYRPADFDQNNPEQ